MASEKQAQAVEKLNGLFAGLTHYAGATEDASLATEFALELTAKTPVYDITDEDGNTRNFSSVTSYYSLAQSAMSRFNNNSVELEQVLREQGVPEPKKAAAVIATLADLEGETQHSLTPKLQENANELRKNIAVYLETARQLSPEDQQTQIKNLGGIDNVVYISKDAYSFRRYQPGTEAFKWFLDECKKDRTLITDSERLAQTLKSRTTPLKNKYGKPVDTLECVKRAVDLAGAANEIDMSMVEKFLNQAGVDHSLEAAKLVAAIREYGLVPEGEESKAAKLEALKAVQQSIQRYVDAGKPPVEQEQEVVVGVSVEVEEGEEVEVVENKNQPVDGVDAVNTSRVDVAAHAVNKIPEPSSNQGFSDTARAVAQIPTSTVNAAQSYVVVKPTPIPVIVVPAAEPQKTTQFTSPQSLQSSSLPVQRQESQPQLTQGHPTHGVLGERKEEQREGRTVYVTPVQDVSRLFGLLKSNPQAVQEAISPPSSSATAASYTLSPADETKIAAAAAQQQQDAIKYPINDKSAAMVAYAKQLSTVCGANLNITIGTGGEAFNVKVPLPTATPKAAAMAEALRTCSQSF